MRSHQDPGSLNPSTQLMCLILLAVLSRLIQEALKSWEFSLDSMKKLMKSGFQIKLDMRLMVSRDRDWILLWNVMQMAHMRKLIGRMSSQQSLRNVSQLLLIKSELLSESLLILSRLLRSRISSIVLIQIILKFVNLEISKSALISELITLWTAELPVLKKLMYFYLLEQILNTNLLFLTLESSKPLARAWKSSTLVRTKTSTTKQFI